MQWFQADLQLNDSKWEQWSVLASHGTHCNLVCVWFQYLSLLFSLSERDWKTVLTWEEPRLADSSIKLSMNSFTWVSNCLIRSAFKCWKTVKTASLIYLRRVLWTRTEGLQKILWSATHHIQEISVIRPENPVSCDNSSCHGHFVLTVAALKGDKWRSCLSKETKLDLTDKKQGDWTVDAIHWRSVIQINFKV